MELEAELLQLRESSEKEVAEATALHASTLASKDQMLRLTADFENYRRRTVRL